MSRSRQFQRDCNQIRRALQSRDLTMCRVTVQTRWWILGDRSAELIYQSGQWRSSCPTVQEIVNQALSGGRYANRR